MTQDAYILSNISKPPFKAGFIGILGAPNAGKSTLLNNIVGEKISITSKKPQTTRNRILGVYTTPSAQLAFLDTPGIHTAANKLNTRIVNAALSAIADVDVILMLWAADSSMSFTDGDQLLLKHLQSVKAPMILGLNKTDLIKKSQLLPLIEQWATFNLFSEIIPVSAKTGDGLSGLLQSLENHLPYGDPLFPKETLTDVSMRFLAAELIREKVFRLTGQEIPYSSAVTIDFFEEKPKQRLVRIGATIHVEKTSQKGIIIGKNGVTLKEIGAQARLSIEQLVQQKVFLQLFVRIQENWRKDTKALQKFGYK